jgi:N-acetyl-anhydromuramyl-L-alanine amidase AmpD
MIERLKPSVVEIVTSPNQSDRSAPIQLIVLHSTESHNYPNSENDLRGVASWFANPSAQVSAHVVVDADGNSISCVDAKRKAWHCLSYNSVALGIEQVGFAAQDKWDRDEWLEACRWIAQWSHEYGIPIRRAITAGGRVIRKGITTHAKLGTNGGGHTDPGPRYPLGKVLKHARKIKRERYGK